jgi:3-deoxy-D-manno-octulosonic-acid transferase
MIKIHHWLILLIYTLTWYLFLPFTFFSSRLRQGLKQRWGFCLPEGPFDLWIQAASVGEAQLAITIVNALASTTHSNHSTSILITTCTSQGFEVLKKKMNPDAANNANLHIELAYFPFDPLCIMFRSIARISPRLVLILETEIWPSFLSVCKIKSIPVILANARMSTRSYSRYLKIRRLLSAIGPNKILAISENDARRFADIFSPCLAQIPDNQHRTSSVENRTIKTMSNIKFDQISVDPPLKYVQNPLAKYFKPRPPLVVLASTRQQEEEKIKWLIKKMIHDHSRTIIALFPRHMHRLDAWKQFLSQEKINWILRSELKGQITGSVVVIWDKFGELLPAYALARSVYVGGSIVPCGGQNFLEPISQGVIPCIGPFWDNFKWVGEELIHQNLVIQVNDVKELYIELSRPARMSRDKVHARFQEYIKNKKGGTKIVWKEITRILRNHSSQI